MHIFALLSPSLLLSSRRPLPMLGCAACHQSHSNIQLQGEGAVGDAIVIRVFNKNFAAVQLVSGKLEPSDIVAETLFRKVTIMRTTIFSLLAAYLSLAFLGCGASFTTKKIEQPSPVVLIKSNEPLAIMPFETESALSNLGGQVSDEVIVNLLEHNSRMKIIPATVVRNYLLTSNLGVGGIPDMHTIHNLKEGLKCKYLLTGNLYTSIGEVKYTSSYSSRIASGSVTVRLIDCDSTNVIWAKHVQSTFSTTTYYSSGGQQQTTYYTDGQLMQELIRKLGYEVARYFFERK